MSESSSSSSIGRQPDLEQGDISDQDVTLEHAQVRDVYGNTVTLTLSRAREIHATQAIVKQGAVQNVEATDVEIRQGGAVQVHAEEATIIQGVVAFTRADEVTVGAGASAVGMLTGPANIEQSSVRVLVSREDATADQSALGAVVAQRVTLNHSRTLLIFGQHIEGEVKSVFGPAASAIFGAAFGAAAATVWLLTRKRKRR
jgi:hypothetical protein